MSHVPSEDRPKFEAGQPSEGKAAALAAWALYILSIPSANLLVIVGLVVAYAARGGATGVARAHIEAQIKLFWSVFWWSVVAIVGIFISIPLMAVLIGFLTVIVFGLMWLVISVWFTMKSIMGIVALADDRAP